MSEQENLSVSEHEPENHNQEGLYVTNIPANNNVTNFDNSSHLTNNDDDIMQKLEQEAEQLDLKKIDEKDIFNKYSHLNEDELNELIKNKKYILAQFSYDIISASKDQEKYKEQLSLLLDKLNEALEMSTPKDIKKEVDVQAIKLLEQKLIVKQKTLQNAKSQSKIYKQQLDLVSNKANERFSTERYIEQ